MPLITPAESRLLALERKQARIMDALRGLKIDAARSGQSIWDGASEPSFPGQPTAPPPPVVPNTTVTGTIRGCNSLPLGAGNAVTITMTLGGTVLGTGTTNSTGVYSIAFFVAVNTGVTVQCVPVSARMLTGSVSGTITAGVTNAGIDITLGLAGGYAADGGCALPVATTVSLVISVACDGFAWPNGSLTYGALPAWHGGTGWISADFALGAGPQGAGTYTYVKLNNGTGVSAFFNHNAALGYVLTGTTGSGATRVCATNTGGNWTWTSVCPPANVSAVLTG